MDPNPTLKSDQDPGGFLVLLKCLINLSFQPVKFVCFLNRQRHLQIMLSCRLKKKQNKYRDPEGHRIRIQNESPKQIPKTLPLCQGNRGVFVVTKKLILEQDFLFNTVKNMVHFTVKYSGFLWYTVRFTASFIILSMILDLERLNCEM